MDDKQLIDSLREKANGMFGETYALLMRAADRLEMFVDAEERKAQIAMDHLKANEPPPNWVPRLPV